MSVPSRLLAISCLLLMFVVAAACGQSSFSPTSSSAVSARTGGTSSGATITGTVNGMTLAFSQGFATAAVTRPVTVTVLGTSISTTIDGSGRFHLDNVPPGDVRLRFTATGLDATVTLARVQAGERIDIKVRVTDTSVRIEAERRERGDDDDDDEDDEEDDDELEGRVSALAGTCPDITFTLNGITVKTSSATRFEDGTCSRIRNDLRVEVEGLRQSDGSLQAVSIELED